MPLTAVTRQPINRDAAALKRENILDSPEFKAWAEQYRRAATERRSERRHAVEDREHAKDDRKASHDDRAALTEDPEEPK